MRVENLHASDEVPMKKWDDPHKAPMEGTLGEKNLTLVNPTCGNRVQTIGILEKQHEHLI